MTLVSIGMPVLNGAECVERALRSLLAQTHRELEIVVCDNASDDGTPDIVERLAVEDPRIRLCRHAQRVNIQDSFRRAFAATRGRYFCFAPADDRWDPGFVERCLARLQAEPTLVAVCPRVAFTPAPRAPGAPPGPSYVSQGTRALLGDQRGNLAGFLADPGENARAFGLFRRQALEGAIPERYYFGWDFQMTARTLAHGGYAELNEVLLWRQATPLERYLAEFSGSSGFVRAFPHWTAAREIWCDRTSPRCLPVAWNLLMLMLRSHLDYMPLRYPRYGRMLAWLAQRLRFRRWPFGAAPVPPGQTATT